MRVLHCIESLGAGGAERQLSYLVEGLVRHGHVADVAYLSAGPYEERLRAAGAGLHRIRGRSAPLQIVELRRAIRLGRADLVQTWLGRMNIVGGVASRSLSRPWIYSERSVRLHDGGVRGAVRQWLGARSSLLVANSEAGAVLWRQVCRPGCAVEVVENGLPLDEIADAPCASPVELGIGAQAEVILWAGRFVAAKNIGFLAQVLAAVLSARPRAIALLCGDGELRPSFRAEVDRLRVGARCLTPGHRADLWSLLKLADVLILPSLAEGQPNVVLEAMAAGCPVALSDIPGHREVVPPDGGLFFSPRFVGDAVSAIERTLDDRHAARARAAVALAAVRRRSLDGMVRAYLRLYARLVPAGAAHG